VYAEVTILQNELVMFQAGLGLQYKDPLFASRKAWAGHVISPGVWIAPQYVREESQMYDNHLNSRDPMG
jgi:hypothetical protein